MSRGQRFAGRSAAVVGAGSGIGRAIALRLAAEGARVTAIGRTSARLAETASLATTPMTPLVCDISDAHAVDRLGESLKQTHGGLDVLVCNSAIGASAMLHETSTEALDAVISTNIRGTYLCLQMG